MINRPPTNDLENRLSEAVKIYWKTRRQQSRRQSTSGKTDQGARSAVTGGAQMDGFISLIRDLILEAGLPQTSIYFDKALELPGYFRPTKKWDLLVVQDNQLILALETKSQVGPSFGNNFNNRTEEALGSALDLWTAFREGAFNKSRKPWLGYLFLLEDCPQSSISVGVQEPHFDVFSEFKEASYATRYEIFCRRLLLERHYDVVSFLMSTRTDGSKGKFTEPADDLTFEILARSLRAHIASHASAKTLA